MDLPLLKSYPNAQAYRLPPSTGVKRPNRVWNLNVLLVDDDPADSALILNALTRHPQVSSAHATDAPEFALRELARPNKVKPNLVLLDIHMPRIDGFDFLKAMRHIPAMADVPVVFLSTSGVHSDVGKAMDSSAVLYVVKPDTYTELRSRVNGIINQATAGRWSH